MELASLIISCISLILVIILLILYVRPKSNSILSNSNLEQIKKIILDSCKDSNELFVEKVKVNLDAQSNVIKEKNDSLFSSLNIRLDNFEKEIESNKSSIESIKKENQEFYSRFIKESNDSNEKIISQLS